MKEAHIEYKVSEHAKDQGWHGFKWSSPGQKGVPDRIYFKDGEVKLIEFKAPGRRPTSLQKFIHKTLGKAGFHVHVIDNIEDGCSLFP